MRVKRPELVLAAATALSLPMVPSILDGAISPTAALVRFLIAILICWLGGSILVTVVARYANAARRTEAERTVQGLHPENRPLDHSPPSSRSASGMPKQ